MRFNDLSIKYYKGIIDRWIPFDAGEKTKPLIIRLGEILDQMEPQGSDNLHTIWASVPRPTFRQYYDHYYGFETPFKEASADEIDNIKEEYKAEYPVSKAWHRVSIRHFTRKPCEEFYALFIDDDCIFSINDCNNNREYEGVDLLEWAVKEAETFVDEVRDGTYKENLLEKIPYIYRNGKIKRSDLWRANPKSKKNFFKYYKKRDINKFLKYFNSGEPGNSYLPQMTARIFFEACAVIYDSLGKERETRNYKFEETEAERERYGGMQQTPKEKYYTFADGRDNGLKNVPMDDPTAFEEWRHNKGPYYEFNGSHPWEVIPSFSTSYSMHFTPWKIESGKYCFSLSGDSFIRSPDTVIAANALFESGYPIEISGLDNIVARIEGKDYISIVPISESTFYSDCINLPEDDTFDAVAEKTTWCFDEYRMKNT